jgi:hypothetical protein
MSRFVFGVKQNQRSEKSKCVTTIPSPLPICSALVRESYMPGSRRCPLVAFPPSMIIRSGGLSRVALFLVAQPERVNPKTKIKTSKSKDFFMVASFEFYSKTHLKF